MDVSSLCDHINHLDFFLKTFSLVIFAYLMIAFHPQPNVLTSFVNRSLFTLFNRILLCNVPLLLKLLAIHPKRICVFGDVLHVTWHLPLYGRFVNRVYGFATLSHLRICNSYTKPTHYTILGVMCC